MNCSVTTVDLNCERKCEIVWLRNLQGLYMNQQLLQIDLMYDLNENLMLTRVMFTNRTT